MSKCMSCGMECLPTEYHPFAACLMFTSCHDGNKVRANLDAVREYGAEESAARSALTAQPVGGEREAFESEMESKRFDMRHSILPGSYVSERTQGSWVGWQARAATPSPALAQGEREVLAVYEKMHEGKLGAHWLWVVCEQIAAGIPETEAMDEFGYFEKRGAQGEAVAWMAESGECTRSKAKADGWKKHGGEVRPLYAHPPAIGVQGEAG